MSTKIQTIDLKWGIDETLIPNSSAYMKNAAGVVGFEDISTELTALGYTTGGGSKFWGTGSDGAIDGTTNVTITGSNNTYIVKNYTSWAAGGAARVLTITPTNCILHIRVQWNMDLTNWTFDFKGKGAAGWAAVTNLWGVITGNPWSPSSQILQLEQNTGWAGWAGWGWWGWWGWAWSATGGSGNNPWSVPAVTLKMQIIQGKRTLYIATWAWGWSWGADECTSWAGWAGGWAIILEINGNLVLDNGSTVIDMSWADGLTWNNTDPGGHAWWGWGGGWGSIYIMYNWTLTWTVTPNVLGGAWWLGLKYFPPVAPDPGQLWGTGWNWLYLIEANTVFA